MIALLPKVLFAPAEETSDESVTPTTLNADWESV